MRPVAHTQLGDVRVSTPGAAAERECEESDVPSRTEKTGQIFYPFASTHVQACSNCL